MAFYLFEFMCLGALPDVCLCTSMLGGHEGLKVVLGSLELDLQSTESHQLGTET